MGGISSVDKPNIVYENCVSFGAISYNKSFSATVSIGCISGESSGGSFTNCFWDESIGFDPVGPGSNNIHQERSVESFNSSSISETISVLNILNSGENAKWCVLNLDSNVGSAVGPVLVILSSATKRVIDSLPTPVREESRFDGWYSDTELTKRFNPSELRAGNTTLYAKWITNTYTIIFIVDGTRNVTTQEFGSNITYPKNPVKEGFTFNGWNDTLKTVPGHDVSIEAKWIINNYTITFIVDESDRPP